MIRLALGEGDWQDAITKLTCAWAGRHIFGLGLLQNALEDDFELPVFYRAGVRLTVVVGVIAPY